MLTAAATACAVATPAAQAGEYTVFNCRAPGGGPIGSGDWRPEQKGEGFPAADDACGKGASFLYATLGSAGRPTGDYIGFSATAPPNVTIKGILVDRWVRLQAEESPDAFNAYAGGAQYALLTSPTWDAASIKESCTAIYGCMGWAWDGPRDGAQLASVPLPNGTSFVALVIRCGPEGYCVRNDAQRAHLRINGIELAAEDTADPQLLSPSGSMLQGVPLSGIRRLSASTRDEGSGVHEVIVTLGDQEIARVRPDASPSCENLNPSRLPGAGRWFDRMAPCKTSAAVELNIDTTRLPEGQRSLALRVEDAAGNVSNSMSHEVLIDNVPPPVVRVVPTIASDGTATGLRIGDVLRAESGVWEGAGITYSYRWQRTGPGGSWTDISHGTGLAYRLGADDVDHQLRVVVKATNSEGSVDATSDATASVKSGKSVQVQSVPNTGTGGDPATAQLVVDREQRTVDVAYGAQIVVTGRLVDAGGNPIASASVDVFEQIAVTAAPWTKVDSVTTDSQGGYAYRPKTTASRRLRFAFADRRESSDYRATREVFVSVTAGMSIKAQKRTVKPRSLIRLSGKVQVDQLPSRGTWVEIQVLDAGVWRTVATRRVNDKGNWAFKHRLRGSERITFTFRARLRTAGDLPSAEAKSKPLKVRVR